MGSIPALGAKRYEFRFENRTFFTWKNRCFFARVFAFYVPCNQGSPRCLSLGLPSPNSTLHSQTILFWLATLFCVYNSSIPVSAASTSIYLIDKQRHASHLDLLTNFISICGYNMFMIK